MTWGQFWMLANLICAAWSVSGAHYGMATFNFGIFLILLLALVEER